jgi:hypothetical protein
MLLFWLSVIEAVQGAGTDRYGVTQHAGSIGNAGGSAGFEPMPGQTIVAEILSGFLQFLQENFGLTPQTRPQT